MTKDQKAKVRGVMKPLATDLAPDKCTPTRCRRHRCP